MIKGLDIFRDHFKDYKDSYLLIGGVACHLIMDEAGVDFRATKDLDIVLCAESLDSGFIEHFWRFVKAGGYQNQNRSTGNKQFYRFDKPTKSGYPFMLELFSKAPYQLEIADNALLTPIPTENEIASLSAILLDEEYYQCILRGKNIVNDVLVLGAEFILPMKAKAWLDLSQRKEDGQAIDSKVIKKHRNDVFRLSVLLAPTQRVNIPKSMQIDLSNFLLKMRSEPEINLKAFGVSTSLANTIESLGKIYDIEN